jgi:hypothetical protein
MHLGLMQLSMCGVRCRVKRTEDAGARTVAHAASQADWTLPASCMAKPLRFKDGLSLPNH